MSPDDVIAEVQRLVDARQYRVGCSRCGGAVERRGITEEFEREGVRVSISGVQALVCEACGEVYLEPGGAQALVQAVNGLFALARSNRQHKRPLAAAIP